MKNSRTTVFMPMLLIILCVIVCVGATYAFFTDSVSSGGNKVQSGRLSVDLEFLDRESDEWISIKEDDTPIFYNENWEPGYTDVKIMKVVNRGSVALKWEARLFSKIAVSEYADIIEVYVKFGNDEISYPQAGDTRDTYLQDWTNIGTLKDFINSEDAMASGELKNKDDSSYLAIALRMPLTAGNEYQEKILGEFDIRILATQFTYESDAFDDQYDVDACLHPQVKYEADKATGTTKGEVRIRCANPKCNALVETQDMYFMFSGPSKGYYTITGVSNAYPSEELIVPSTYCGLPVKAIEKYAFSGSTKFTSVIISEGITTLGHSLFTKCSALKFVSIPSSVTSFGDSIFNECPVLETVVFGADIQIKELNMTFNYCSELKNVTIPESVKTIGQSAFRGCTNLKSINIPDNVEIIGTGAFMDCGLETIEFGENTKLTSIGSRAFSNTTVQNFTVPDGVTTIGDYAFQYAKFTKITIPTTVTRIGIYAFGQSSLQRIDYQGTVVQWMTMTKGADGSWNQWFAFYVYCTDGIVYEDTRFREKDAVTFDGTVAQWLEAVASIQLPFSYEITCTDGVIAKDGTITYN